MARLSMFNCTSPALTAVKWSLIVYNILFWILGILSLSTGIYLYVDSKYATFTDGNSLFGASVLAAIGFGVLVIGFVGMVSAVWESRLLTIFFALLVSLVAGTYLTAGVWAIVQKQNLESNLRIELNRTMYYYDQFYLYRDLWNDFQTEFECCGIDDWTDWKGVLSYGIVPDSCCISTNETDQCGQSVIPRGKFYSKGCLSVVSAHESFLHDVVAPIGISCSVLLLPGIILCIILYRLLSRYKKSYTSSVIEYISRTHREPIENPTSAVLV